MHIQKLNKKWLIFIAILFILLIVLVSYSVPRYETTPSSATSGNCTKTGANIATYFNKHYRDNILPKINQVGPHWVEGYAWAQTDSGYLSSQAADIAEAIKVTIDSGHEVILRVLCTGCPRNEKLPEIEGSPSGCCIGPGRSNSPAIVAQFVKNLVNNGARNFYFIVGHNEPNCSEFEDPQYEYDFITQLKAELESRGLGKGNPYGVKYLLPQLDLMCNDNAIPDFNNINEYLQQMHYGELLNSGFFDGAAVGVYNIGGNIDFNLIVNDFYNRTYRQYNTNLPIFVTETGAIDQNFSKFRSDYDNLLSYSYVKVALIFNMFYDNKEFAYHASLADLKNVKNLSACFADSSVDDGGSSTNPTESRSNVLCRDIGLVVRFKINKTDGTDTGLFGSHHHDIPIRDIPLNEIKSIDLVVANSKTGGGFYGDGITIYLRNNSDNSIIKEFPNTSVATITDLSIFDDNHQYKVSAKLVDREGHTCWATNYFTFHGTVSRPSTTEPPVTNEESVSIKFKVQTPYNGANLHNRRVDVWVGNQKLTSELSSDNTAEIVVPSSLLQSTQIKIHVPGYIPASFNSKLADLNNATIQLGKYGDFNGDGHIGADDFAIFASYYVKKSPYADADGSGNVWAKDYAIFVNNLNETD